MNRTSRRLLPPTALALAAALFAGQAVAGPKEDERATNAVRVLNEIQRIPENGIPDKLLDEGKAIIVIPDTLKAGLVIGGRRGHGLMSVKNPDGSWSQPVFVKLTGGSIGFQAGVQSSDVVLVFRNDRSLDSIVNGKVTLGADAGVAAGPVGRNASAATDGQLKAVYGSAATPRAIFESRAGQPSDAVVGFRDQLEEVTELARGNRGTGGAAPSATTQAPAPAVAPVVVEAPAQTQGFEPVQDGEVRTEPLDGTP